MPTNDALDLVALRKAAWALEEVAPDGWIPHLTSVESANFEVYWYLASPDLDSYKTRTLLASACSALNAFPHLLALAEEAARLRADYERLTAGMGAPPNRAGSNDAE